MFAVHVGPRVKDRIKRMSRPVVKPVFDRLRVDQVQVQQIAQHMPVMLNAIATQNATAREFERAKSAFATELGDQRRQVSALAEAVARLEERIAMMRQEVLYEARYGAGTKGVVKVEARRVDLDALIGDGLLRINLGSGNVPREGFVNVDARDLDGVDVVGRRSQPPVRRSHGRRFYASHLVEHFPLEELRRAVLPHWLALLRPGGLLVAVAPDGDAIVRETAAGRMPFHDFQRVTFGDQDYDGDFHFALHTPDCSQCSSPTSAS